MVYVVHTYYSAARAMHTVWRFVTSFCYHETLHRVHCTEMCRALPGV